METNIFGRDYMQGIHNTVMLVRNLPRTDEGGGLSLFNINGNKDVVERGTFRQLVFLAYGQHRKGRLTHNLFCNTTQIEMRESSPGVGHHDHQIGTDFLLRLKNAGIRVAIELGNDRVAGTVEIFLGNGF